MQEDSLVISQKKLKLLLGGLGIALPTLLYLGNYWVYGHDELLSSMSGYYYTDMRDIFVGILFSIGLFLVAYEGYDLRDRLLATIGGLLMIMVALFPTSELGTDIDFKGQIHLLAAAGAYFILMIFAFFLFTKTDPTTRKTIRKRIRNVIYRICGIAIFLSLLFLILTGLDVYTLPIDNSFFWLEYIANSAFGTAWLVKGEGIFFLNDDPILKMQPWEIFGFFILILLAAGSVIMLSHIFLISFI